MGVLFIDTENKCNLAMSLHAKMHLRKALQRLSGGVFRSKTNQYAIEMWACDPHAKQIDDDIFLIAKFGGEQHKLF